MLGTHHLRLGLEVRMLPWQEYPSGMYLGEGRKEDKVILKQRAFVRHYCWTVRLRIASAVA